MVLYGTTFRVGDHVGTDAIIAPEQRADDPAVLAAYCLASYDPTLAEQVREGDMLLAGAEFGAGSEPDEAVLALQAVGFAAVVCVSAAAQFIEAAETFGLPVLVCPDAVTAVEPGGVLRLDLARGRITDRATGVAYSVPPCAPALLDAVRRAQLLLRMRRVVDEEGFDG